MSIDTITTLPDPSGFSPDPLTGVIRDGAGKLIEPAIEVELAALTAATNLRLFCCSDDLRQ